MKFRITASVLILTTCATLAGAENQKDSLRVPGPEEIYEAYAEGLIEYQDYRELLEISRAEFLSAEDSAFLRQFPDLLTAPSTNPVFNSEDEIPTTASTIPPEHHIWKQSALMRQYARLDPDERREQLYRVSGSYSSVSYYGEMEHEYSGVNKWSRRYLRFELPFINARNGCLTLGSHKERIGLGLIYGYHGQLLSKSSDRGESERLLYPNYGGGNGAALAIGFAGGDAKLIYDTDRNETFAKNVAAFSFPLSFRDNKIALSALYGRIRRRDDGLSEAITLVSVSGNSRMPNIQTEWEMAAANKNSVPLAGAVTVRWKQQQSRVDIDIWSYNQDYPSYFCGGPSSHRSRTIHLDDLDLAYSDRYQGETGLVIKTSSAVSATGHLRTAAGYTRREFDDDRLEARIGWQQRMTSTYSAQFVCYWRGDRLYSDIRKQGLIQLEISRSETEIKGRLVMGHRIDRYNNRRDFLILAQSGISGRWGTLSLLGKVDRFRFSEWCNNYSYLTLGYGTPMGPHLNSYIKYTYRYRRQTPGESYGMVRVDLAWIIK